MMDQDKKESSNWGWFILAVLAYGVVMSLINGANNAEWRADIREANTPLQSIASTSNVEDPSLFQLVSVTGDHEENTCCYGYHIV